MRDLWARLQKWNSAESTTYLVSANPVVCGSWPLLALTTGKATLPSTRMCCTTIWPQLSQSSYVSLTIPKRKLEPMQLERVALSVEKVGRTEGSRRKSGDLRFQKHKCWIPRIGNLVRKLSCEISFGPQGPGGDTTFWMCSSESKRRVLLPVQGTQMSFALW